MDSMFSVAVHALVYLNHKNCIVSSEALAENICTNPARVRKVMAVLKKAGLVTTKTGQVGGYRFDGDAQKLTLEQVASALGVRFVDCTWRSGDEDMECLVASGMADIMDSIYLQLDRQCRDSLRHITIADIDQKIFGQGKEIIL
ncbi:MAG: Rrf2 family transcriptional regulator [Syntrophomonadaceae bacterium]|nr:Rrf2 family transcriptional regulator [Syntrophomonadaceae bacterium]